MMKKDVQQLRKIITVIFFTVFMQQVNAQTTTFLDINPGPASAFPFSSPELIRCGDVAYFGADNLIEGPELFKVDFNTKEANLVMDINPGSSGSFPSRFTKVGDSIFLQADDGLQGDELFILDINTEAITQIDINPGGGDSRPRQFIEYEGDVYFVADNGVNGKELHTFDRSTGMVTMVDDLRPGSVGAFSFNESPNSIIVFAGELYFQASDDVNGLELFKMDNAEVITLVADIVASPGIGSAPQDFFEFGGNLYFTAITATAGRELWVLDGTTGVVSMVADINAGSGSGLAQQFIEFFGIDGVLYFPADNGTNGVELHKLELGVVSMVEDINVGAGSSNPNQFTEFGGNVYFAADDGLLEGDELISININTQDVSQLTGINPGFGGLNPGNFTPFGNKLLFTGNFSGAGFEIGSIDANSGMAMVEHDIMPGSAGSFVEIILADPLIQLVLILAEHPAFGFAMGFIESPPCPSTSSSFSVEACDFYTASNGRTINSSQTIMDTIPNHCGGDSVMTIEVTIIPFTFAADTGNITINEGDSVRIAGVFQTQSGTYRDTLDCEITVTILTVLPCEATSSSFSVQDCDFYTTPSGRTINFSQTVMDTIPNHCEADSVMTIEVNIVGRFERDVVEVICEGDSILLGGTFQTQAGNYTNIVSGSGFNCDTLENVRLISQKGPVAKFSLRIADTTQGFVTIVNESIEGEGFTSYTWDFGDKNAQPAEDFSIERFPRYTYSSDGPHQVCLGVMSVQTGKVCESRFCDSISARGIVGKLGGFELIVVAPEPTGIDDNEELSSVIQIYPNPAKELVIIAINLKEKAPTEIFITDIMGNKIKTIANSGLNVGDNQLTWNASDTPSGIYFVNVSIGNTFQVSKLVLNR